MQPQCPTCGGKISRLITATSGKNQVEKGDLIITAKTLMVVKSNGDVLIKCPYCKTMIKLRPISTGETSLHGTH